LGEAEGAGIDDRVRPVTRSAIRRPAPGPMPKSWPEKPVATKKPGISATGEITGTASGATSISPAQYTVEDVKCLPRTNESSKRIFASCCVAMPAAVNGEFVLQAERLCAERRPRGPIGGRPRNRHRHTASFVANCCSSSGWPA
jgi:hypothetical protein